MISRLRCFMHICFTASILLFVFGTPLVAQEELSTVNKDYSSQRYVDLDQITPQNVGGCSGERRADCRPEIGLQ